MKPCRQCGVSLAEDAVKCPECGAWNVPIRGSSKGSKKKGTRGWVLLLGIVALGWAGVQWGPMIQDWFSRSPEGTTARVPSIETIRADLERLFRRQEEHYRDRGTFAGVPSLLDFRASEGVRVSMVSTGDAWSGTAVAEGRDQRGCAVFVGSIPAPREPVRPETMGVVACASGPQEP